MARPHGPPETWSGLLAPRVTQRARLRSRACGVACCLAVSHTSQCGRWRRRGFMGKPASIQSGPFVERFHVAAGGRTWPSGDPHLNRQVSCERATPVLVAQRWSAS